MLFEVSDLYCELDRPIDTANLLEPELKHGGCQNISSGSRLQLALSERLINLCMWEVAEDRLLKFKVIF